ncbi:hypothetical protein [Duganella sp. Root1480D1]|uniref:hypothetical protein n=1 Tax=Duganella sp. Root1480D1 TaxID=1736471 RepID=UPI000B11C911|nr:hypothetical protein [Duganella sp. Root1480D1]
MKTCSFLKTIAAVLGALATVAATPAGAQTPTTLSEEFKTGNLKLEYSVFGKGISGTEDLKRMYDNKNWEELVKGVVSKRFVVNTYYFYLGAAAEGLGYPVAAHKYYELAAKTPEKCTDYQTWTDSCVGFKFPDEAVGRMAGLVGAMGEEKSWLPGQGPIVNELVGMSPTAIENLLEPKPGNSPVRDKFETDDEYNARMGKMGKGLFAVAPLDTKDSHNCLTTYDHAAGEYKISRCLALVGGLPLRHRAFEGSPIRLANAITSRDIRRDIREDYYYTGSYVWNQSIKVSRDEAKALDDDLMVGIVAQDFGVLRKCRSCDSGRGPNWKDEAFVRGSLNDSWMITVRPINVQRIVVYRRLDSRVLYSFSPNKS